MTFKTESDLVRAYIEKYDLKYRPGGTPLPASLGNFPICPNLMELLESEGLMFSIEVNNSISVSDNVSSTVRRFSFRGEPIIWVRPKISVDSQLKAVICKLVISTGDGETFVLKTTERICKAITRVHPKCHTLIQMVGRGLSINESWNNVGFGKISPLSEIFDCFATDHDVILSIARAGIGIFKPYPSDSRFLINSDLDSDSLLEIWEEQFDALMSKLEVFRHREILATQ